MLIPKIGYFLEHKLKLKVHFDKIIMKTLSSGVGFLGWMHFFNHIVLKTSVKKTIFDSIRNNPSLEVLSSYLGLLKHGNCSKIKERILKNNYI